MVELYTPEWIIPSTCPISCVATALDIKCMRIGISLFQHGKWVDRMFYICRIEYNICIQDLCFCTPGRDFNVFAVTASTPVENGKCRPGR